MPNSTVYNILQACREPGCPLCRLEQQSVERYLNNHFYEDVNSPKWRDSLRASLGFCHEHAWLGVQQRLGDALGYSIIYHDIVNSILSKWEKENASRGASARNWIGRMLDAFTARKRCPVCEQRDHTTRTLLSALVAELGTPEMSQALESSDGLCLPHLRSVLERVENPPAAEQLLRIHRGKLESLRSELAEFIRKNDYQAIKEGFGKEGDAWLRAIATIVGKRKEK